MSDQVAAALASLPGIKRRGFGSLKFTNPDRLREIAANGGASLRPDQRSFSQDRALAVSAGRKGSIASVASRKREG